MGNNHNDAMTKKSKHPEHSRELMVGANQCGSDVEWAFRAPDSDVPSDVGFWRYLYRYQRPMLFCSSAGSGRVSLLRKLMKVVPRVSRPFSEG